MLLEESSNTCSCSACKLIVDDEDVTLVWHLQSPNKCSCFHGPNIASAAADACNVQVALTTRQSLSEFGTALSLAIVHVA
jgi:hypothetical protein